MSVIKHGKKNDIQRFKCKDCAKTFNDLTLTPMAKSNLKIDVWLNYAKCMVLGFSIRKSANIVNVSVKTSFYMRHRILDAIRNHQGIDNATTIEKAWKTGKNSKFKQWMERFNGVSTKYLANYLHWYKWLDSSNFEKDIVKAMHLLVDSATKLTDTRISQYRDI